MMRLLSALALLLPLAFAQYIDDPDRLVVGAVFGVLRVEYGTAPRKIIISSSTNMESTLWVHVQEHAEEYYNVSKDILIQAEENYGLMPLIGAAIAVSSILTCLVVSCYSLCFCRRKKAKTGRYQFSKDEIF